MEFSPPLLRLPHELLRQIIQHLVQTLPSPLSPTSAKTLLLPLASTSKRLRAVSAEFLFGSVDIFEVSFGRERRALPSDLILQRFRDLVKAKSVHSFVRVGVRRLLVRDRDCKAFENPNGLGWLADILGALENLRSIHFDGDFYSPLSSSKNRRLVLGKQLRETLVNLTFINVCPRSPIFRSLFSPQPSLFSNLTRIDYRDNPTKDWDISPSPFQSFTSIPDDQASAPMPHLSTFVFRHCKQRMKRFEPLLRFLHLHRASLQRISLSYVFSSRENTFNLVDSFDPNYTYHPPSSSTIKYIPPGFTASQRYGTVYLVEGDKDHGECMKAFWDTLERLDKVRLLEFNTPITMAHYAPERRLRMKSLKGVIVKSDTQSRHLAKSPEKVEHPVTTFYNRLPCAHLAYWHTTRHSQEYFDPSTERGLRLRTGHALEWLLESKDILHRCFKTFTYFDVEKGGTVFQLSEGQSREVTLLEDTVKIRKLNGVVGDWNFDEHAEREHKFMSEDESVAANVITAQ